MTEFESNFSSIYFQLANAEQAPRVLHSAQQTLEDMKKHFLLYVTQMSFERLKNLKDWVCSIANRMQHLIEFGIVAWEIESINGILIEMCNAIGRALILTQPEVQCYCVCICKLNGLVVNCDSKWQNVFPLNPLGLNLLDLISLDYQIPNESLSVTDYIFEYYLPDVEFIKSKDIEAKEDFIQMYQFDEYLYKLRSLVTKVQLQFTKQQGFQFNQEDLTVEGVIETYLIVQTFRIPVADDEYSESYIESDKFDELFRIRTGRQQALLESDSEYAQ